MFGILAVNCGPLSEPIYGYVEGTEFTLGHTMTVGCQRGFRLIGSTKRTCLSNGQWSGHNGTCEGNLKL